MDPKAKGSVNIDEQRYLMDPKAKGSVNIDEFRAGMKQMATLSNQCAPLEFLF